MEKTLKISKIKDGTVIDHISAGKALEVLNILGSNTGSISIGIRVNSKKMGLKDVLKIENVFLEKEDLDRIALIAPDATISIVKNYDIIEKFNVEMPEKIYGIVKCSNQNCITNANEPVKTEFIVDGRNPVVLRCLYCNRSMSGDEIVKNLI